MKEKFAQSMTMFFRFFADLFFRKKYGHRAVVLETIAGVPGMVAGMIVHMRSLRRMERGNGAMIQELLDEAMNERKHLMFFIEIAHPTWFERRLIYIAQFLFFIFYFLMYVISPSTAHLMIHYFEKEAVKSYTDYLTEIEAGNLPNVPCPKIAIDYYGLKRNAKLYDMIECVREDEQTHAVMNKKFSKRMS